MLEKRVKAPANTFIFIFILFFLVYFVPCTLAWGAARPQDKQQPALGSLAVMGEVHVNGAAAPAESSIFPGDLLRSGPTGSATFFLDGKGSFEIRPNTQIIFTGEPQYAAELKFGKVVMNSANDATGINLRAGSSVVLAVAEGEQSSSTIEAPSDGSFVVTCVTGSVGVIPLQSGKGVFIRAGQSVGISAQGELSTMSTPVLPLDPPAALNDPPATPSVFSDSRETAPAARRKHGKTRWILLGAGIAGAGVAAAILSAKASTTPSSVSSVLASPPPPISSNSGSANSPTPPPQAPSQPVPQPSPSPSPAPAPPANGCHDHQSHDDKGCKPHVVVGFAFHF
jgi:hypothetical protein